jgi:hypothetical protein
VIPAGAGAPSYSKLGIIDPDYRPKNFSCHSLQFCNDSAIPAGLTAPKAFGIAEVDGRSPCGAGCGHTPARFAANAVLLTGKKGREWQTSENLSCQKLRFCNHPRDL